MARFTPPRAGTFIYHTHWHDVDQLARGLYGPLVVLPPGQRYDPETDHVVVIGLNGVLVAGRREPFALNGRGVPARIRLAAGRLHRLRVINITPFNVALVVSLMDSAGFSEWRLIAKDGADLPTPEVQRPARQPIAVGETYDFEIQPSAGRPLWLEVRRGNGEWILQAPIVVR